MPEKFFKKLNAYILPQWRVCFLASIIVGLIAHLYKITGWLPNWDSLVFRYAAQNMIGLGRWFLPVACAFTSFYDLPFLNGIVAIIFHGLSAICICRILDVKKKVTAALIGAIVVSFPVVTSVMMYNYVADGYSIAFFLATLAALFMTKEKPNYLLALIFTALSSGIYQAYITVTIMLVLLKLIDDIIYNSVPFIDILKKSVLVLLSGLGGVAVYGIILKIILSASSVELLDYQGINTSASLSSFDFLGSLYVIKETFVTFFFDFSKGINLYLILNVFAVSFTIAHYVKYIIINKIYKKPVNVLTVLILAIMLILGAGALAFINAGIDYHNLMLMGYAIFYLFFLILYERGTDKEKHTCIKCWTILLTAIVIISNQVVTANVCYHKAQMAYEKSYGVLIRIADRIEQTDGTEDCEKILVLGALDNSRDYSVNLPPDITGITDGYIIRADDETVGQSVFCSTINDYCGKNYKFVSGEEKKALALREEVKRLGKWPEKNCVAVVDGTIIIKLNSEGENK